MSLTNSQCFVRHVIWFSGMLLLRAVSEATDTCNDWRLPVPGNGARFCETTAGTMRCNITCDLGHYFEGASHNQDHVEYSCMGGSWTPGSASVPACTRIDYCENVTCLHGGTCLELFHEAECICKPGYAGAICETDVDDCATAPCLHGGTCIDDVSGFRCRCDVEHFVGETCSEEKVLNPVVNSLSPEFGPAAGGTVITLEGKDFIYPVESVFIGNHSDPCDVTYSDRHKIIAVTPPSDTAAIGVHAPVRVMYAGGLVIQTTLLYQYRVNPKIQRVYPLATVPEGGTTLTVQGTDLDAVLAPWLELTMVYTRRMEMNGNMQEDKTKRVFSSRCTVITDAEITCQTPALSIPPEFRTLLMSAEPQPFDHLSGANRVKRQTSDSLINFSTGEADLEFFIGFMFDGYRNYSDLAEHETLGEFGRLSVHRTPRIRLYDPTHLMHFEKHKAISIVGEYMNAALFMSDYHIEVGMSTCGDLEMDGSILSCMPPQSKPQRRSDNSSPNPMVMVKFGSHMQFEYAQMKYGSSNTLWIGLGCAAALLVTAIVVLGILIARHRRKQLAKHKGFQNRQLPHPKQPNVFIKDSVQPVYTNPLTGRSTPDESYEKPVTPNSRERNVVDNSARVYRGYYEDRHTQLPFGYAGYIAGRQSPTSYDRSGQDDKPGRYRKNKNPKIKTHIRKAKQRLVSDKIGPKYPAEGFPGHHDSDEASYLSLEADPGNEVYLKLTDLLEDENFYVDIEEALRQAGSSDNPRREFQSHMIRMVSRMSRKVPRVQRRPTMYPSGYSDLKPDQPEHRADAPRRNRASTTSSTGIDPMFNEPIYNTRDRQVLNTQVGSTSPEPDPMSLDGDPIYMSGQQQPSGAPVGRLWRPGQPQNASAQPGSSRNTGYNGRMNVHSDSMDAYVQDIDDSDGEFIDNPDYVDQWHSKADYTTGSKLDRLGNNRGSHPGRFGDTEEQTMPRRDDTDDWPVYRGSNWKGDN